MAPRDSVSDAECVAALDALSVKEVAGWEDEVKEGGRGGRGRGDDAEERG